MSAEEVAATEPVRHPVQETNIQQVLTDNLPEEYASLLVAITSADLALRKLNAYRDWLERVASAANIQLGDHA